MGLFSESFSSVVGMGLGMAPNRSTAQTLASECGLPATAEFWLLFGDLERTWVECANKKEDE